MRRLCSRPACSLVATAVFGFDPDAQVVWLGPLDAAKRVGDLCDRHARAMVPPHGWSLDDRRAETPVPSHDPAAPPPPGAPVTAAPTPSGARRAKGSRVKERPAKGRHDVPLPFDATDGIEENGPKQAGAADPPAEDVEVAPERAAAWTPRFDPDDDLGGLLDAKSPLLSRAFRNDRDG